MRQRHERLNDTDRKVLVQLENDWMHTFRTLSDRTGFDVPKVRRICRRLKRMGYAYHSVAYNEDEGQPWGSGYALTLAGQLEKDDINASA